MHSWSTGSEPPSASAPPGTANSEPAADAAELVEFPAPSVLTLAAWYDIFVVFTLAGFSPGRLGPSCAVMSDRAAAVAAP